MASKTIVDALEKPVTCNLTDLLVEYGYDKSQTLVGLSHIDLILKHFQIIIDPEIGLYDVDSQRTLKPQRSSTKLQQILSDVIKNGGESYGVELKSSISIDTKKKFHNPGLESSECQNEELRAKVAQEISAFLNRDGGILIFGVTNDLKIVGCEDDFSCLKVDGTPQDKADLIIKKIVDKYFHNPKSALSHIQIDCEVFENKHLVLLSIAKCDELTFLKTEKEGIGCSFYRRIGTSADPIQFHEIESHYNLTSKA